MACAPPGAKDRKKTMHRGSEHGGLPRFQRLRLFTVTSGAAIWSELEVEVDVLNMSSLLGVYGSEPPKAFPH